MQVQKTTDEFSYDYHSTTMGKNMDKKNLPWKIADSGQGFDYWLSREYVSDEIRPELEQADLLLVPQEGFRDREGPLFPVGTERLHPIPT